MTRVSKYRWPATSVALLAILALNSITCIAQGKQVDDEATAALRKQALELYR
jgi:type II secretory pathway component PulL